jgi:hypothetical protein
MHVDLNKIDGTNNFEFASPLMVPDQGNLITVENCTHTKADISVGEFPATCHLGVHGPDHIRLV